MYIFELNYPGTWLIFENDEVKDEIESIFRSLEGIVTEAAIALSLFERACDQPRSGLDEWKRDQDLRQQIDAEIRAEVGNEYYQNFDKYRVQSEKRLREKKVGLGILPRSYLQKIPFIHAHTFVFALDSFGKFLEELNLYDGKPSAVQDCLSEFNQLLPSIRKIRNSALHIEDRCRGYGSWKEKQQGKKMDTNGFLGLSNLESNQLCYTVNDGSYQRVEISAGVLNILVQLTNRLLAGFQWSGSERIEPQY